MAEHNPWEAVLSGGIDEPLTDDEIEIVKAACRWYIERCTERGASPPRDVLRCLVGIAYQVMTWNIAMDAALVAQHDADDDDVINHDVRH